MSQIHDPKAEALIKYFSEQKKLQDLIQQIEDHKIDKKQLTKIFYSMVLQNEQTKEILEKKGPTIPARICEINEEIQKFEMSIMNLQKMKSTPKIQKLIKEKETAIEHLEKKKTELYEKFWRMTEIIHDNSTLKKSKLDLLAALQGKS